jgi:hypothetical protein
MALPRSKYSAPKHTPGKEFTLLGKDYVGWYIVTFKNDYFTGKEYNKNSKKLLPVLSPEKSIELLFIEESASPDRAIIIDGFWTRYFVQKAATQKIIEVKKQKYLGFKKTGSYKTAELKWKIQGPAENVTINGYTYFGADHTNRHNTKGLESQLPGISNFIKNYSEFVE